MKVAYISTYPPRRCGIGTFTHNLVSAVSSHSGKKQLTDHAIIIAIEEEDHHYHFPEEVKFKIRTNHQKDYLEAAHFINFCGADICVLQHEFGIFGGEMGVYILSLLHHLTIPLVTICHTVLKDPTYMQRSIVHEISKISLQLIVMSQLAVDFFKTVYKIPAAKINFISHGTPLFSQGLQESLKQEYNFQSRTILLTFGLLNRNKGIDTVLHALPEVVKRHPEVLYIVLGTTHPAVLRLSGEEYKEYLKRFVDKYALTEHVFFYDQFVSESTLKNFLSMCDIYVTPYLSREQITSGTLSYAMGAGACIISTPYWHATELLSKGRGILFDFKNYNQLQTTILKILDQPGLLQHMRKKASAYGKKLNWPRVGKAYWELLLKYHQKPPVFSTRTTEIDLSVMPRFDLSHIYRLTDDVGVVQYAKYGIPNLKHGYNLSDNSRAVLMSTMVYQQFKDKAILELVARYLSYIQYMQNVDGTFHNALNFDRTFKDELGTEDAFSRTMWALGYLLNNKPSAAYKQLAKGIFLRSVNQFDQLRSLRGIAATIIGITYFLKEYPEREDLFQELKGLTRKLVMAYDEHATGKWQWFEDVMTYDNGILPLALLLSYEMLEDEHVLSIARMSLEFLVSVTHDEEHFAPVGNQGWYPEEGSKALYDQGSGEAMCMVRLFYHCLRIFRDRRYLLMLFTCYRWYLGINLFHIPLYDHETCGCYDGLIYKGVNKNEGAESTLAYLISHITVLQANELSQFRLHFQKDENVNPNLQIEATE